jgi:hypothetical protein
VADSVNANVSSSVPSGTGNGTIAKLSGMTFQIYLGVRQIVQNTAHIVDRLDALIGFFRDQYIRSEQDQERRNDRNPTGRPEKENSLTDGLGRILEGGVIKATILGLLVIIENLTEKYRKEAEALISTYLVFVRKATLDSLAAIYKTIVAPIGEFLRTRIINVLNSMGNRIISPEALKAIEDVGAKIGSAIRVVVDILEKIVGSKGLSLLSSAFKGIYETIAFVTKAVFKIFDVFLRPLVSLLTEFGAAGAKALGYISRFLGKVFLPLQLLLSLIDFVNGFIEGYEKGGIIEGVKEGLMKAFDGFFTGIMELVKDVIAWVLDKIGFKNLSVEFSASVEKIIQDIRKIFSALVDIFIGLATLDPQKIWDGLKSGFGSLIDFVVDSAKGSFQIVIAFFKDIFGNKFQAALNYITDGLVKDLTDLFTGFAHKIVDWLKGVVRDFLENIPGGKKLADSLLGAKEVSQDDIENEAKRLALKRELDKLDVDAYNQYAINGIEPKYTVTDDDRKQAATNLKGATIATPPNPSANQQVQQLSQSREPVSRGNATLQNMTQINTVNTGGRGSVNVLSKTNTASQSNPLNR